MSSTSRQDVRLANAAWEAVMVAHAKMIRTLDAADVFSDITMREYDVLYTLAKAREPQRISDVAAGVLLSQPGLSRMLERLEARGLIARTPCPSDKRAIFIALTPAGVEMQQTTGRKHARSITAALSGKLTAKQMQTLQQLAQTISG